MSPSKEIELVCTKCGASNRPGVVVCWLCSHGLGAIGPETGTETRDPQSPTAPPSLPPLNPYEAASSFPSPALTFHISSLLMVIAVVAICLGVAHENVVLGIVLSCAVAPALAYTVIVADSRKARGRPMASFEKVGTFFAALAGVVAIAFSAFIAFGITCFSLAVTTQRLDSLPIVVTVSIVPAVAAAALVTYRLLTRKRRHMDGQTMRP